MYRVRFGTEKYGVIAKSNICKTLTAVFGISDVFGADLTVEAEDYLLEIGVDSETVEKIKETSEKNCGTLTT